VARPPNILNFSRVPTNPSGDQCLAYSSIRLCLGVLVFEELVGARPGRPSSGLLGVPPLGFPNDSCPVWPAGLPRGCSGLLRVLPPGSKLFLVLLVSNCFLSSWFSNCLLSSWFPKCLLSSWFKPSNAEQCKALQYNAKQCKPMLSNAKQCQVMPSHAKPCQAAPSNAKQCQAMQCKSTPSNAKQCQATLSNAKQCRTMQSNAKQ